MYPDNRRLAEMAALQGKQNRLAREIREREQAIHDIRESLRLLNSELARCRERLARLSPAKGAAA